MKKNIICDECGKNTANVYFKQTINGKTEERNLCEECAAKLGIGKQFDVGMDSGIGSLFNSMFSDSFFGMPLFGGIASGMLAAPSSGVHKVNSATECPVCHSTIADIRDSGRFGCGSCYNRFSEFIDTGALTKGEHKGKKPLSFLNGLKAKKEKADEKKQMQEKTGQKDSTKLAELKADIKKAVADEDYEKAAHLRDEIRALESGK